MLHTSAHPVKTAVPMPLRQPERIQAIDAIRGFALCGILLMNLPYFALPYQWVEDPRLQQELSDPLSHFWWAFIRFFMEGSMRGLFSLLFGAGTVLLLSRLEKQHAGLQAADIYFRRLLWLLLFGLVNGFALNWPGDVLFHYAIVGMFIFPFRKATPRLLLFFVALFVALTMALDYFERAELQTIRQEGLAATALKDAGKKLSEAQEEALDTWKDLQGSFDTAAARKEAAAYAQDISTGSFGEVFEQMAPVTAKFESTKFYGSFFFDVILFFLLGMLLYNTGIITGHKKAGWYAALMAGGYLLGGLLGWYEYQLWLSARLDVFVYLDNNLLPFGLYQLHRICTTLGHLGLLLWLWKLGMLKGLFAALARMGQMAFTNYLGQSLICGLIFYGYGLGYFGKVSRPDVYMLWLIIIVIQMAFSNIWLAYFRFGPLEWVWRSLTYWKKQPIKLGRMPVSMP